jgi:outer membrane protein insertion porin family
VTGSRIARWPLAVAFCALASTLFSQAQDPPAQEPWEGKIVRKIHPSGFRRERFSDVQPHLNLRERMPYDALKRHQDLKRLFEAPRKFADVRIEPQILPTGEVDILFKVVEFQVITDVRFSGLTVIPLASLTELTQKFGEMLDPYLLKRDRDLIRDKLVRKGYHFARVESDISSEQDGAILHWRITQGPLVGVRSITITGNRRFPTADLKALMQTKESWRFLIFPSVEPYVQFTLEEDLKRLKLAYYREGWLDIAKDDRIFVEDLDFSSDRTSVDIRIHIDEGEKYRIRSVSFKGHTVIKDEEMRPVLLSKPGDEYTVMNAATDAEKVREMYGERAYILAQVEPVTTFIDGARELDLEFRIVENQEITVGRIIINGNTKTRFDVILRELKDFAPGEKFNRRLLQRGLQRLRERQYFDPMAGFSARLEEGQDPGMRDVVLDVKEGTTGSIRFAGGYSSSFGILGIIEFEQKNFDIADLPKSISDIFTGEAFAGGGQHFQAQFAPARTQKSFRVGFREPHVFGYDFGMGVQALQREALRESWEEEKLEGSLSFDRRFDPFEVRVGLHAMRMNTDDLDADAPFTVRELEGVTRIFSITTGISFDNRDSIIIPTQGHKVSLSYEYAGKPLPGDFDFGKVLFDLESYFPTFEIGPERRHVVNFDLTLGFARERGDSIVPFFERYTAGGRGSIRGFDFRGVGPRESGDPIGGNAYAYFSAEYAYPLVGNILWLSTFYDLCNLTLEWDDLYHEKWRNTVGFGIKFVIPQLGNIPVSIDFGFPLTKRDDDDRETVTFDIGRLFF